MASPLDSLKAFAATKNGKLTLGGGAVGGVVLLALARRKKAAAAATTTDPGATAAATTPAPSYIAGSGSGSGSVNGGVAGPTPDPGTSIDPNAFNALLQQLGNTNDALSQILANQNPTPAPGVPATPPPTPVTLPTPNPAPAPAPPPVVQPAPAPAPAPQRTYTVVKGDTLSGIAQRFYGNANKWPTIYNANKGVIGSNSNLIKPGQRLVIP